EQIVGRERRERVSHHDSLRWVNESLRRVNSTVRRLLRARAINFDHGDSLFLAAPFFLTARIKARRNNTMNKKSILLLGVVLTLSLLAIGCKKTLTGKEATEALDIESQTPDIDSLQYLVTIKNKTS